VLYVDGVKYRPWVPSTEEEFEDLFEKNTNNVLGEDVLYLPLKTKLKTLSGIGSIPDGYAIGLTKPNKWYIIEVELSTHPIFQHIVPQLNKFIQGLRKPSSRRNIAEAVYNEIKKEPITEAYVKEKIGSGELYRFISSTIEKDPTLIVVIDNKTRELEEACDSIPIKEKLVSELRVYERVDSGIKNAFIVEPLFEGRVEPALHMNALAPTSPAHIGSMTSQKEYELPLLESLIEVGGGGKASEVSSNVFSKMENRLTEADLSKIKSGAIRWKKMFIGLGNISRTKGTSNKTPREEYGRITEEGRNYYEKER